MIMVNEKRTDLLGHPVCMALIRNKWNKFGRQAYIFTLLLNLLFCVFLTIYTIATPAPYSHSQIAAHLGLDVGKLNGKNRTMQDELYDELDEHKKDGYGTEMSCKKIKDFG